MCSSDPDDGLSVKYADGKPVAVAQTVSGHLMAEYGWQARRATAALLEAHRQLQPEDLPPWQSAE
jgi:hypothetical protein